MFAASMFIGEPIPALLLQQSDGFPFIWVGLLIVLVLGLFGVVVWLRRRLSPHEDFHGEGFTLGDLRRLHKEGKLSADELDRAKAGIIAAAQRAEQRRQQEQQNLKEWGSRSGQ